MKINFEKIENVALKNKSRKTFNMKSNCGNLSVCLKIFQSVLTLKHLNEKLFKVS